MTRSATLPSAQALVAAVAEDAASFSSCLDAERYVSRLCTRWDRGACHVPGEPVAALRDALVTALEQAGTAVALGMLRTLAFVAGPPVGVRADIAAARLTRRGVPAPPWTPRPEVLMPCDAARWWDLAGDRSVTLFIEFAEPAGLRHTLAGFVDDARGGIAKHLAVLSPLDDLEALAEDDAETTPTLRFQHIAPAVAANQLLRAITRTDMAPDPPPVGPGYRDERAFAIARLHHTLAMTAERCA